MRLRSTAGLEPRKAARRLFPITPHAKRETALKISVLTLSAAMLALASFTPATAAPAAPAPDRAAAHTDGVTLVQHTHKRDRKGYDGPRRDYKGHKHGYRAGHRYKHAPKGWHRYSHRPGYWQTRGCIMVGPVWFCP